MPGANCSGNGNDSLRQSSGAGMRVAAVVAAAKTRAANIYLLWRHGERLAQDIRRALHEEERDRGQGPLHTGAHPEAREDRGVRRPEGDRAGRGAHDRLRRVPARRKTAVPLRGTALPRFYLVPGVGSVVTRDRRGGVEGARQRGVAAEDRGPGELDALALSLDDEPESLGAHREGVF